MTDIYGILDAINVYALFTRLLNRSIAAAVIIAFVMIFRIVLKKAPKKYVCILWGVVALSLILPVKIASPISAWNLFSKSGVELYNALEYSDAQDMPEALLNYEEDSWFSGIHDSITAPADFSGVVDVKNNSNAYGGVSLADTVKLSSELKLYLPTAAVIWTAGLIAMIIYMLCSYLRIRRSAAVSTTYAEKESGKDVAIRLCDTIPSPFILGVIRPVIYVPSAIAEVSDKHYFVNHDDSPLSHVIAHEKSHIRHLDHWWKFIGFILLAINWFNPLAWIGYVLFSRDMEACCDESVIESMDMASRKLYSRTLLGCSSGKFSAFACPLAFCENGTKGRVKNILSYRKPAFWITVILVICCMVFGVAFLTSPSAAEVPEIAAEALPESFGERFSLSPQRHFVCFETHGIGPLHISLYKNGSFDFSDGTKTVCQGVGTWEQENMILTITEDEALSGRNAVNHFRICSTGMAFVADGSDGFPDMELKDGAQFYIPATVDKNGNVPAYSKARYDSEINPEECPRCHVGIFAGRYEEHYFSGNVKDGFGLTEHYTYLCKMCDNLACRYAEDVKQVKWYSCYSLMEEPVDVIEEYLTEKYGIDVLVSKPAGLENGTRLASGALILTRYEDYKLYYLVVNEFRDGEFAPAEPCSLWLLLGLNEDGSAYAVGDADGSIHAKVSVDEIIDLILRSSAEAAHKE